MGITEAEADKISDYIKELQRRMKLEHWVVVVELKQDPEPDIQMSITPAEGGWVAHLHTGDSWAEQGPEDRRRTLVHELLHLCHRAQTDVVRVGFPATELIPTATFDGLWRMFEVETERMVDHLTQLIAPHMPAWE